MNQSGWNGLSDGINDYFIRKAAMQIVFHEEISNPVRIKSVQIRNLTISVAGSGFEEERKLRREKSQAANDSLFVMFFLVRRY